jgi:hypothetical protein
MRGVLRLALPERLLRGLAVGDVLRDAEATEQRTRLVVPEERLLPHPLHLSGDEQPVLDSYGSPQSPACQRSSTEARSSGCTAERNVS